MSRLGTVLVLAAIASGLAVIGRDWQLRADESAETQPLKPLPKFLRTAKLAERYLSTRDIREVLEFERTEPVCEQLLTRPDVPREYRLEAATKLAELRKSDVAAVLLSKVSNLSAQSPNEKDRQVLDDVAALIPSIDAFLFKQHAAEISKLATSTLPREPRRSALVALAVAEGSSDLAWRIAQADDAILIDLLSGLRQLTSRPLKEEFFAKIFPLLKDNRTPPIILDAAIRAIGGLPGDHSELFERLADFIDRDQHVDACIDALRQIPESAWSMARIEPLAADLIDHLRSMPLADRSTAAGHRAFTLITSLASRLPPERRGAILSEAQRLQVQSFHVRALPEKMAYDVTVLVVESGRPIQIVFQNDDIMPHNLVVGSDPEARVELGLEADEMQNQPDALSKGYLPTSDKILTATKLIQPGQSDSIEFVLPEDGVFPFVCTFPGHWSKMYGAIKVVADSEAYLTATQPIPSSDDLLGIRTVAWTIEELLADVNQAKSSRSFASGERWFRQASCYSCHRMRGLGGTVGPDLTDIHKKHKTPSELLPHIMEPSKVIDDAYAAVTVQDTTGKIHQGIVVRRTDKELVLRTNPLGTCEPTIIPIEDIDEESKSKISAMPEKLLNTILTKSEIYDLLAYIMSGGDETAQEFSP